LPHPPVALQVSPLVHGSPSSHAVAAGLANCVHPGVFMARLQAV
jgi:hypothetical protein